jgi:hypothetical protein
MECSALYHTATQHTHHHVDARLLTSSYLLIN